MKKTVESLFAGVLVCTIMVCAAKIHQLGEQLANPTLLPPPVMEGR